jgi:hypothetical protein
VKPRGYYFHE